MEQLLKQVRFLADHGINHQAGEQTHALLKIVELLQSEGVTLQQTQLTLAKTLFAGKNSAQIEQLVNHNHVKKKLRHLLNNLKDSQKIDPLIRAIESFLLGLEQDPLIRTLCQSEKSLMNQIQLGHFLEADLAEKLNILWKVLVRYGEHFAAPPKLSNADIDKKVRKNRDPSLKHFYPKTIDLLELLIPQSVYRFSLAHSDRHRYRQSHELIWQNGLRLMDPTISVRVEKSHISDRGNGFFIDLKLDISGRSHEWFYSVDELIDESIFEDLKRFASETKGGNYLIENYGQSRHYAMLYLPHAAFEKIVALA